MPKADTVFYHWDDGAEELSFTDVDDALEDYYQECTPGEEPDIVKIYSFKPRTISEADVAEWADSVLEKLLNDFDEEYNCLAWQDPTEATHKMQAAAVTFVKSIVDDYEVNCCEEVGSQDVDFKQWILDHHKEP